MLRSRLEVSEPGLCWAGSSISREWHGLEKARLEMGTKQLGNWGNRPSRRPGVGKRPSAPRHSVLQPGGVESGGLGEAGRETQVQVLAQTKPTGVMEVHSQDQGGTAYLKGPVKPSPSEECFISFQRLLIDTLLFVGCVPLSCQ